MEWLRKTNIQSVENAIKEECSDDQTATEKECTSDEKDKDCKKKGKMNDRAYKVKGKHKSKTAALELKWSAREHVRIINRCTAVNLRVG